MMRKEFELNLSSGCNLESLSWNSCSVRILRNENLTMWEEPGERDDQQALLTSDVLLPVSVVVPSVP